MMTNPAIILEIKVDADTQPIHDVVQSTRQISVETRQADRATSNWSLSKRDLVRQFKALKYEAGAIPGIGAAIHAIRSPITLIALGIGLVISKIREWMQLAETAKERLRNWADTSETFGRMRLFIAQTRLEWEELKKSIEDARNRTLTPTEISGRIEGEEKTKLEGEKRILAAQKELEIDRINRLERNNAFSKERAERERRAIEDKYSRLETETEIRAQLEAAQRLREVARAERILSYRKEAEAGIANEPIASLRLAVAIAEKELDNAKKDAETEGKKLDAEIERKKEQLQAGLRRAQHPLLGIFQPFGVGIERGSPEERKLKNEIANLEARRDMLDQTVTTRMVLSMVARENFDSARAEIQKLGAESSAAFERSRRASEEAETLETQVNLTRQVLQTLQDIRKNTEPPGHK